MDSKVDYKISEKKVIISIDSNQKSILENSNFSISLYDQNHSIQHVFFNIAKGKKLSVIESLKLGEIKDPFLLFLLNSEMCAPLPMKHDYLSLDKAGGNYSLRSKGWIPSDKFKEVGNMIKNYATHLKKEKNKHDKRAESQREKFIDNTRNKLKTYIKDKLLPAILEVEHKESKEYLSYYYYKETSDNLDVFTNFDKDSFYETLEDLFKKGENGELQLKAVDEIKTSFDKLEKMKSYGKVNVFIVLSEDEHEFKIEFQKPSKKK